MSIPMGRIANLQDKKYPVLIEWTDNQKMQGSFVCVSIYDTVEKLKQLIYEKIGQNPDSSYLMVVKNSISFEPFSKYKTVSMIPNITDFPIIKVISFFTKVVIVNLSGVKIPLIISSLPDLKYKIYLLTRIPPEEQQLIKGYKLSSSETEQKSDKQIFVLNIYPRNFI